VILLASIALDVVAAAPPPIRVGILPFDVVSVDSAGADASAALAKLVRIEMIKGRKLTPVLVALPPEATHPVPSEQAASLGKGADVGVVLVGTVVEASTSQTSRSASTGSLLGSIGIGGSLDKSSAKVLLHLDLVDPATGKVVDSFDAEGKASQTGVGMDFSTALGDVDTGGDALANTPMGKALSDAARKVSDEVAKRAPKFAPKVGAGPISSA
jgi:curli biogenesis system outer membrane secretion channel CsgG